MMFLKFDFTYLKICQTAYKSSYMVQGVLKSFKIGVVRNYLEVFIAYYGLLTSIILPYISQIDLAFIAD